MPLARANGCALTHPLSACCQQERTLRTRQSQGPGVICRPRSRRQKRSKPLPRPLWQNEAKKPRSLKRLQPGADCVLPARLALRRILPTGGGYSTRELYTDQDEILFNVVRPVIVNGI